MGAAKPWLGDAAIALLLAVVGVLGTIATDDFSEADRPVDLWAFAMVLAAALSLVVRRSWPLATLAVAAGAVGGFLLAGYPYGPVFLPFFVAVYTMARYRPLGWAVPASLIAFAVLLPHLFTHPDALPGMLGLVPATAWVVVPFSIGVTVRTVWEAARRERAAEIRRRVYDERLRISQEVHDVVGHGLAAIKMQADVALHLLERKPEQAERALTAISRTSTEALDEVRTTLETIRGAGSDPEQAAVPGLDQLSELRDRMSQSGVEISLEVTGTPRGLPTSVDLAAYRVVQESLTNVLRHTDAGTATVGVHYDPGTVSVLVSNPAPETSPRGEGLGISGMRERVNAQGGTLSAGPTRDGRFEVRATIPIGGGG
ncbi:sensor histidine kinase [Halostreptopolyspora alba]|uniref:histidine kinase n=1 Tax=Halostreptopolyspora alba TaxID=2487137 RepID=A0A3N0EE02_9ACTN|nr:sensor histidine kinase [Nocardiopsaceae bacterium YIM 96095]